MEYQKNFLIAVLSFMLLFSVSCSNDDKTGGGNGGSGNIPKASGTPITMKDIGLSGLLKCTSLNGNGWTTQDAESFVNDNQTGGDNDERGFILIIKDNKAYGFLTATSVGGCQLFRPDNSKPNVVESGGEDAESRISDYINITFDDIDNPTKADVKYELKMSDEGINIYASYEGALTNNSKLLQN